MLQNARSLHKHNNMRVLHSLILLKQVIIFLPWGKKEVQGRNNQQQNTLAVAALHALCFHRILLGFSGTKKQMVIKKELHNGVCCKSSVSGYKLKEKRRTVISFKTTLTYICIFYDKIKGTVLADVNRVKMSGTKLHKVTFVSPLLGFRH